MSDCPSLARDKESRHRAWRELQRFRAVLELLDKLEPPPKPPAFHPEGIFLHLIGQLTRTAQSRRSPLHRGNPWSFFRRDDVGTLFLSSLRRWHHARGVAMQ